MLKDISPEELAAHVAQLNEAYVVSNVRLDDEQDSMFRSYAFAFGSLSMSIQWFLWQLTGEWPNADVEEANHGQATDHTNVTDA